MSRENKSKKEWTKFFECGKMDSVGSARVAGSIEPSEPDEPVLKEEEDCMGSVKIVNLVGRPLRVNGFDFALGEFRALAPNLNNCKKGRVETLDVEGYGQIPLVFPNPVSLSDCYIKRCGVETDEQLPFPAPVEGIFYVVPYPVRTAAIAAGRTDVIGVGELLNPSKPDEGATSFAA